MSKTTIFPRGCGVGCVSLWPHGLTVELDRIETGVLGEFLPPLNLDKVVTPWREQVKAARKVLATEARRWSP